MKKILAISEPKTFYHGTASVFIEALLQEIKITGVQNLGFRSQGPGFYTTVQLKAAEHFAFVTAENHSGKPVYCIVEVQNFAQMTGYNRIDHTLVTPEGIIKCSSSVKPSIYVKKVAKDDPAEINLNLLDLDGPR